MKRRYKGILLLLIVFLVLVMWQDLSLELISGEGDLLMVHPINHMDQVVYESIHSVSLTRLQESIEIHKEGFFIIRTVKYEDQSGAGLPEYTYDEAVFYIEDNWFVIDKMNRRFDDLEFWVDAAYENTLTISGTRIPLYKLFEKEKGSIRFEVKKQPQVVIWLKNLLL